MCTISWLFQSHQYHVFFNRDEQRSRAAARPPQILEVAGCRAMMPQDPQGKGSWVASNSWGLTLALLNYYQGLTPQGPLRSRGQIIKQLAGCKDATQVGEALHAIPLGKFAPFSLLVFSENLAPPLPVVPLWCWDGRALQNTAQSCPLISSGRYFEEVVAARKEAFDRVTQCREVLQPKDFYRFHRYHGAQPSAFSVCMHREDACTVSFSHIQVGRTKSTFRYHPGSACRQPVPRIVTLRRCV